MHVISHRWATRQGLARVLALSLMLLSVDYFPNLPDASIDSSWMNGIAIALANGVVFGKDLLFTYGPLSTMTTGYWGGGFFLGLILALAVALNLGWLMKVLFGARFLLAAIVVFLLAPSNEALFYIYIAFLPLAVASYLATPMQGSAERVGGGALLVAALLLPALTLSKMSFAPPSLAVLVFASAYAAWRRRYVAAMLIPVLALASLLLLWMLAGQDLRNLSQYLFHGEIIAGYTGAMEWDLGMVVAGVNLQLIETLLLYALTFLLLCSAARMEVGRAGKLFLIASLGAVLTVVIKAAVARHGGGHSIIPWIVLAVLALFFLNQERVRDIKAAIVLTVALVASLAFSMVYSGDGSGMVNVAAAAKEYALQHGGSWQANKSSAKFWLRYMKGDPKGFYDSLPPLLTGAAQRIDNARELVRAIATSGDSMTRAIATANDQINAKCRIPRTEGSADIYPNDINCLTAKGIRWAPRPVFQSYSAYTPVLLEVNSRHLEGSGAPDHVYFNILPIDARFPSLEDGQSWACLAANYRPEGDQRADLSVLKKVGTPKACPVLRQAASQAGTLGRAIHIGCDRPPIFATFEFKQNLMGLAFSLFYKQRRLVIDVKLCGGELVTYKFIPSMARTPFLLSPVVPSAGEFNQLFFGGVDDRAQRVESFTVRYGNSESPVKGWDDDFEFKTLALQDTSALLPSLSALLNRN